MKKACRYLLPLCAVALFCSCHKTCTCINYNGYGTSYTADQVSEHGGSCAGMIIQSGKRYYSVCTWE